MRAARHQVIACALGRRLGQHRRFDVDETLAVEEFAHRTRDGVTLAQARGHDLAAQIDVAVLEPHFLAHLLVELERQRVGAIQDLDGARHDLDAAGSEVRVDRTGRALAHLALDAHHELVAELFGVGEHLGRVRVADDLHQALAVAQVDEDHAAVVAPPMHPADDGDRLAAQGLIYLSAIVAAHDRVPKRHAMLRGYAPTRKSQAQALSGPARPAPLRGASAAGRPRRARSAARAASCCGRASAARRG